jgi:hypothetical protein
MNINELYSPIKVCDLVINPNDVDRALWNINWNRNVDNSILSQKNGRCYYIVVNEEIFKIGYSDCDGGIKSTINSYRSSGNSGRPSDRTHGIHVLITEQLLMGNKVEIYFHYNPLMKVDLTLMDGSVVSEEVSISGKKLELKNMEIYKNKHNDFPVWNLQEAGKPWPTHIQESRNNLLAGNPLKINEIKNRLVCEKRSITINGLI